MHSCELITNLRAKKVMCHRIEVARISGATTTDCVFCNVIGYRRITPGKALSNQLNEDRGIGRRSPDPFSLERGRGLGTRLRFSVLQATKSWAHIISILPFESGPLVSLLLRIIAVQTGLVAATLAYSIRVRSWETSAEHARNLAV